MVKIMKKSIEISGLPIISISDGNQIGIVKSLVINPDKGSVDFLTIEHEDFQVSVKAIPFKKVVGIGEYAVTVESENAVIDLNEIPIANQLVNKKIKITNTRVMTRKGELLGEVQEYYVNQDTGQILGMELKLSSREAVLSSEIVVTFGKDIIIVKEDAASHFLENAGELSPAKDKELPESRETIESLSAVMESEGDLRELREKQVELLNGRKVTEDILAKSGDILIPAGTILTSQDIEKAQEEGPSTVVELSFNVEA
jgi:uncharacterized protein YrrD